MELTDIHNRRDNITTVANDCKANHYPLIAWPEDKELLRLGDLPRFVRPNIRPSWLGLELGRSWIVGSDASLRDLIVEDRAYSINPSLAQFNEQSNVVQEWIVTTR